MSYGPLPDAFPVLGAGRWRLRQPRPDDAAAWLEYASDPVAIDGTSADVVTDVRIIADGIELLARSFREKTELRWVIADSISDEMVGSIGFLHLSERDRRGEMGYDLVRRWWGQGIATAAASAVVAYGFNVLALTRIEATVMVGNAASMRVLEKLGFEREGVLRRYKLVRGEPRDFVMFSLIE